MAAQAGDYTGVWAELGEMHYAFETCAAGYDMDALVKIFPDHACPVEHWGYVFKGQVRVEYTDGREEVSAPATRSTSPAGTGPACWPRRSCFSSPASPSTMNWSRNSPPPGCFRTFLPYVAGLNSRPTVILGGGWA